jgi:hypothetical protein
MKLLIFTIISQITLILNAEICSNQCISCQSALYYTKLGQNAGCKFNICPELVSIKINKSV